jgi:hypothetical protein
MASKFTAVVLLNLEAGFAQRRRDAEERRI